jgi:hypothetical protein
MREKRVNPVEITVVICYNKITAMLKKEIWRKSQ